MEEPVELLATRRSRRSTAGNRMEAALAEMALDDASKDIEDDQDFENLQDEEDVFGSDFESTDEEADKATGEALEQEGADEDRRRRKTAKSRLEKVTAAAHARNKATFAPEESISARTKDKSKPKPKMQRLLGLELHEQGSDVVETISVSGKKRVSQRKHTVLNTSATVTRLKESVLKRATQPKKAKIEVKRFSQAQLIARALDNEDGNIRQHRDYLKNEEEKRKRARVVRTTVEGPLLRWVSKEGKDKLLIPIPPSLPTPAPGYTMPAMSTPSTTFKAGQTFIQSPYSFASASNYSTNLGPLATAQPTYASGSSTNSSPIFHYYNSMFPAWPSRTQLPVQQQSYYSSTTAATTSLTIAQSSAESINTVAATPPLLTAAQPSQSTPPSDQAPPAASTSSAVVAPTQSSAPFTSDTSLQSPQGIPSATATSLSTQPTQTPTQSMPPLTTNQQPLPSQSQPEKPPEPQYRIEKATKNFLVHELAQAKGVSKPTWTQTMTAMFGDHVRWGEVKVFAGKGRPLARPKNTCPITGMPAKYFDSRTGVPFADTHSYKILTELLHHHYEWSPTLSCYVGKNEVGLDAMVVDS